MEEHSSPEFNTLQILTGNVIDGDLGAAAAMQDAGTLVTGIDAHAQQLARLGTCNVQRLP